MPYRSPTVRRLVRLATLVAAAACSDRALFSGPGTAPPSLSIEQPPGSVTLVGAGSVARCDRSWDEATARLLDAIPGTVFTTGDHTTSSSSGAFRRCYDPSWGRHRMRTQPAPGEVDYQNSGDVYFGYFGETAGIGGDGYYSYDLGDWHVVVLNSSVPMQAGSAQEQWLRADLAASPRRCTAAFWHYPRFSSSGTYRRDEVKPLWDALYAAGVELVVNGHHRVYERFAPQTPDGAADPAAGIRQFTVGTGGVGTGSFGTPQPNSEVRRTGVYGVLQLTLSSDGYLWRFVPVAGQTWTDAGGGTCHGTPAAVDRVDVTPSSVTLAAGETAALTAVARNAAGDSLGAAPVWSSGDSLIATVSPAGVVTGRAAGSAAVIASLDGRSDSALVSVTAAACRTAGATWLNQAFPAQSGRFTVTFDETPGGDSIDAVTGLAAGPADGYADLAAIVRFNRSGTIDARSGDAYTAGAAIPYVAGARYRFRLEVDLAARTYGAWVTPPDGVERVIGTGLSFRTEQAGATSLDQLAALSGGGTVGLCNFGFTAPPPVATVEVTPPAPTLLAGETVQLTAVVRDATGAIVSGTPVMWRSTDSLRAAVTTAGLVTGVAAGSALIVATAADRSDTATVTVSAPACQVAGPAWANAAFPTQDGVFTARFDATPAGAGLDGVVGLAPAPAAAYADLAAIIRFSTAGTIDARDGSTYRARQVVSYAAGTRYAVRLAVDVAARSYSAFVAAPGGTEDTIALGYAFRSEQGAAAALSDLGAVTGGAALTLCDFRITASTPRAAVASVTVTPAAATLLVGDSVALGAVVRDAAGTALTGRAVTWSSSNGSVASVGTGGLVRAIAAGSATISAASEGRAGTATITVTAPAAARSGFYVSPDGSSANDGSRDRPWSLAHALSGAAGRLAAGDTVWLRGGTYRGSFRTSIAGQPGRPIVFRQYPGERATVDGGLRAEGADLAFWGFEIMQSNPVANGELPGLLIYTRRGKFINLVVHDAAQQGITFWDGADDAEVYGTIAYNNGLEENKDHGIYVHNNSGTKLIQDNVFFNNLAYGIHAYAGPNDVTQRNLHLIGNVAFNNGAISSLWTERVNLLIGGEVRYEGMKAIDNMLYFSGTVGRNMWIGYTASNGDVEVRRNWVWGGASALEVTEWQTADIRDNTIGGTSQMVDLRDVSTIGQSWSNNRYYRLPTAMAWRFGGGLSPLLGWQQATGLGLTDVALSATPPAPTVFVRPNRYEAGRAHVVIYNWTGQSSVSVDLSGVLAVGRPYEIRNVQALFGAPVATGTYLGGSISIPMTGVAPPTPIGRTTRTPPRTGPAFDTFLVTQP
jgi:uncharacterized protein YjdB